MAEKFPPNPHDVIAPLVLACERIADALERANQREAWPQPPPVCTGTGQPLPYLMNTSMLVQCPICGQRVGCEPATRVVATHPYIVRVSDPDGLLDDAKEADDAEG